MKFAFRHLALWSTLSFALGLPLAACTGEQTLGDRVGEGAGEGEAGTRDSAFEASLPRTPCVETCLRFGPPSCTRVCVQACVENASCVGELSGRPLSSMHCLTDRTVTLHGDGIDGTNFFDDRRAVRCLATKEYSGGLPDAGWNTGKRVFVTKQSVTGDIKSVGGKSTGLESADAVCASEAASAGLDGRWVAWLSDAKTPAESRLKGEGPWYSADRSTVVFRNRDAFLAGPQVPIRRGSSSVWTGSTSVGNAKTPPASSYCSDWTGRVGAGIVGSGQDATWSDTGSGDCFQPRPLICFEQP